MSKSQELANLISHIPNHQEYRESKLIVIIPTTSEIDIDEVNSLIQTYAHTKGWTQNDIEITKKAGYTVCKNCGKALHMHIRSPHLSKCIYCGARDIETTKAEIVLK